MVGRRRLFSDCPKNPTKDELLSRARWLLPAQHTTWHDVTIERRTDSTKNLIERNQSRPQPPMTPHRRATRQRPRGRKWGQTMTSAIGMTVTSIVAIGSGQITCFRYAYHYRKIQNMTIKRGLSVTVRYLHAGADGRGLTGRNQLESNTAEAPRHSTGKARNPRDVRSEVTSLNAQWRVKRQSWQLVCDWVEWRLTCSSTLSNFQASLHKVLPHILIFLVYHFLLLYVLKLFRND